MFRAFTHGKNAIYLIASLALATISLSMIGYALIEVWKAIPSGGRLIYTMLDAVGLIVISLAVFDVSKYLLEEEVLRRGRELRSPREARQTLTKFLVIIIIAVSLEALVFIFGTGSEHIEHLLYPAALLMASVALIVALGVFQRLSVGTERGQRDADG